MTKTKQNRKNPLKEIQKTIDDAKDREDWFWWQYMDQLHVFHRFYDLFLLSKKKYPAAHVHLLELLQKRGSETARKRIDTNFNPSN